MPSPEMYFLFEEARKAAARVQEAKGEYICASDAAREFWDHILADRIAVLKAIEAKVRELKETRGGTPDAIELFQEGQYP